MIQHWPGAWTALVAVSTLPFALAACPHDAAGLLDWHSPATWPGGVPAAGAAVSIPVGQAVVLRSSPGVVLGDVTIPATSRLILGWTGSAGDPPILFNTTGMTVAGSLVAGSPDCPIVGAHSRAPHSPLPPMPPV
jgi:hypothetical protein